LSRPWNVSRSCSKFRWNIFNHFFLSGETFLNYFFWTCETFGVQCFIVENILTFKIYFVKKQLLLKRRLLYIRFAFAYYYSTIGLKGSFKVVDKAEYIIWGVQAFMLIVYCLSHNVILSKVRVKLFLNAFNPWWFSCIPQ
jgi:hypothetical protein